MADPRPKKHKVTVHTWTTITVLGRRDSTWDEVVELAKEQHPPEGNVYYEPEAFYGD